MADPNIDLTSPLLHEERPTLPTDTVLEAERRPGVLETAAAFWRRETLIGSAFADIGLGDARDTLAYDHDFNPYAHWSKNRETLKDMEEWVRKGAFDYVTNSADFDRMVRRIRQQKADLEKIEQGSGWGVALGVGLSILDVATLIPFAKAKTGAAVASALRVGGSGAVMATAQEAGLHAMQPTRTAEETFWNIGTTTALAGGIGVFSSVLHPKSPLNPANNPPLGGDVKHPIASMLPGMSREEADIIGGAGSVGAARQGVKAGTERVKGGKLANVALKGAELLSRVTPSGRATLWSSGVMRDKALRMFDLGGIFTRHMDEGIAHEAAAEDLFRDHLLSLHEINQELVDGFRRMQMDMGVTDTAIGATVKNDVNLLASGVGLGKKWRLNTGISEAEFQEIVRRKVTNEYWQGGGTWTWIESDKKWFDDLVQEAGLDEKAVKVIESHTDRAAKLIQRKALEQEEKMFQAGMITEDQRLGVRYGLAQLWDKQNAELHKEELRGLLLEIFQKRPDVEWLRERGLSLEDWQKLPERTTTEVGADGAKVTKPGRRELMEEWLGDEAALRLERAKVRLDAAERAYKDALSVHEWTKLGLKVGKAENAQAKLGELRAAIRAKEADNALDRLAVYGGYVAHYERRVAELRKKLAAGAAVDETGGKVIEGFEAVQRITGVLDEAVAKGNVPAAENLMALYERAVADLAKWKNALDGHMATLRVKDPRKIEGVLARARADEAVTEAKLAERLRAIEAQEGRVATLNERLAEATAKRREAWAQYKALREAAKRAGVEARLARKDLSAAKREMAKAERKAAIFDVIDDLVDAIANTGRSPNGLIREIGESGRTKDRRLIFTTDERRLLEQRGFLHSDLQYNLDRQYRDISARLALREAFGEESLTTTLKEVEKDYQKLIDANPAKAEKLRDELKRAKKDLIEGRDRLLGIAMRPEDPDSLVMWGLSKLRQSTYLRFAAGFPLSSLVDLATQVLHNGFGKQSLNAARRFYKVLKDGNVNRESRELRILLLAAEMSMAHSTASRQFLVNEMELARGAGSGVVKKLTSALDRPLNTMQSRMNVWTGMSALNAFVKGTSGLMLTDKLSEMLPRYDALTKLQKAELASLGIGRAEAKTLQRYFEKYGERDEWGFHANAWKWGEEKGGSDAARIFRIALRRHADRSSPTPGIGDMPLAMSHPIGRVLLQFQSYGFASVNRVLTPALQRGLLYKDARALGYLVAMVPLATLVATIRAYMNGKDPGDYTSGEWMREVLDRGGLVYYLSPYVDAIDKVTGFPFGGGGLSDRYRNNKWWHSLLGPSLGTLDTIGTSGTSLVMGDLDRAREKGLLLLPFNQVWRLGNAVINQPN